MNQSPAISVVLPVYNAEAYVREAVESILAQTFTDFELIIINDGSTDGSGAILRELAARDARIVLVERPNDGLVSALNDGIKIARADLIARMDADDVSMPERFALQHARMVQEPELAVLGSFICVAGTDTTSPLPALFRGGGLVSNAACARPRGGTAAGPRRGPCGADATRGGLGLGGRGL